MLIDLRLQRALANEPDEQREIGPERFLRARSEGMEALDARIVGAAEIAEAERRLLAR
ncbi:MAG TPA: hypothetical protein VGP48_02995 [Stellaceae bacterium]|nr:hypothetical protein [Stellaceae bacterium]